MKMKIKYILICILIANIAIPATSIAQLKDYKNNNTIEDVDWWPMLGHDPQHTGFSTSVAPNTNNLKWYYETGCEVRFSSPVVVDDKLYIGTSGASSKENQDFNEIKKNSILETFFEKNEKNTIDSGNIFCINTSTGDKEWDFTTQGSVTSTPVIYNGLIYVLTSDSYTYEGQLYCLNAQTGSLQWNKSYTNFQTTPTIEDDNLFIATADPYTAEGNIICLDPSDGSEKWSQSTGINTFAMLTAPTVKEDKLLLVLLKQYDVTLYCFDVATGNEYWHSFLTKMELGLAVSTPVVGDDKVYVMSLEAYYSNQSVRSVLFGFDIENGDNIWKYRMEELDVSLATPAIFNGNLYFSYVQNYWEYGGMACIDADTGDILWDQRSYNDFFTFSNPSIADNKLYICAMNQFGYECDLHCFDINSGEKLWSYILSSIWMIDITPAIADEKVFAISPLGTVFAFEDELKISDISGGIANVNFKIENSGDSDFSDIYWKLSVSGGILSKINIEKNNTIGLLESQTSKTIRAFPLIGLGKINVNVTLTMEGINPIKKTKEGFVIGFIVIIK